MISYNTWPEADKKRPKLKVRGGGSCNRLHGSQSVAGCRPYVPVHQRPTRPPTTPPASVAAAALQAVAALLQEDNSAIVTLKSSGIDRPAKVGARTGLPGSAALMVCLAPAAWFSCHLGSCMVALKLTHAIPFHPPPLPCPQLDGKRYASYAARFEGRIVQQMLKADGGSGDYQELALPMLGVFNTLLKVRVGRSSKSEFPPSWPSRPQALAWLQARLAGAPLPDLRAAVNPWR